MLSVITSVSKFSCNLAVSMASALETKTISEIILVDDCHSLNNSIEVRKIAKSSSRIKYYKNSKNLGIHLSLIKALEKSNSGYIMILNPENFIIPNAIDKLFDYTQNHKKKRSIIYSRSTY